ncbi:putative Nonspecific lipid-transfer protein A [Tripterygium wilfordii]|uniref:Non-specific lipid-transfer protein n=1 Tax=Tripterygium wilfordii TaxID=458696 RepID=A0A7J7CJW2_TRIWF|nr:putative Nonspecific lipid-transfer protein A [Tripterygium wilfordii]
MNRLVVFLAILALVFGLAEAKKGKGDHTPSCTTVINDLQPCFLYLMGIEKSPDEICCKGVKKLAKYAKKKKARKAICECAKSKAATFGSIDLSRVSKLPKECGVSLKLPHISPNIDCSK